jgi:hypothetical protein
MLVLLMLSIKFQLQISIEFEIVIILFLCVSLVVLFQFQVQQLLLRCRGCKWAHATIEDKITVRPNADDFSHQPFYVCFYEIEGWTTKVPIASLLGT